MKVKLVILILILFVSNYEICEFLFPYNLIKWWTLRQIIYNVIICLCLFLAYEKGKRWLSFWLSVVIGLCVSNCIDRVFFDTNYFTFSDIIMVILTVLTSYYKHVYAGKIKAHS